MKARSHLLKGDKQNGKVVLGRDLPLSLVKGDDIWKSLTRLDTPEFLMYHFSLSTCNSL